jgi:Flp pilus assembly protein CpaB
VDDDGPGQWVAVTLVDTKGVVMARAQPAKSRPPARVALARQVARHRRSLAFLLAFAGVLVGLSAIRPERPSWPALVVGADLAAGHVLVDADLRIVDLDPQARPATAVTAAEDVLGRALAGPMSAGEMVLTTRVVGPGLLGPDSKGQVAMPVRIEDAAEVSFLRPGDRVDVLAAAGGGVTGESAETAAVTVARRARVLAVPGQAVDSRGAGPLDVGTRGNGVGSVLVVAVPARIAALMAGASARSRLSVVLNSS